MGIPIDSGFFVALSVLVLLSLLAAAANQFGADSRPTDRPDVNGPAEHHS